VAVDSAGILTAAVQTQQRRKQMADTVEIHGHCDERLSAVREAFARNFDSGDEAGASFAVTIDGEYVVDIWGGYADAARERPWEEDTIVNVYSTTKAMTTLCALMLVDRGLLDLDAPVARYWPEFAQAGKEGLPVRYLLSHQAGLAGFDEPIPAEALYDWDRIIGMLAAQRPWWEPGKHSGYHSLTFGYTVGELVRRITGKTLGTFFRKEVAVPLGADFHIGLSAGHDSRVAELIPPPALKPGDPGYVDPALIPEMTKRVLGNPVLTAGHTNDRAWRAAEIPASNGHGNARSVARLAAALARGGELDGVRLLGMPTVEKAIEEQCYGPDLVLAMPIRFGLGFGLVSKEFPISPNPRSFWWGGAGGSRIVVDLDARLSWAYIMNQMFPGLKGDPRSENLSAAVYASL
jgi:CubicO group peptidase (beta-lactamase class C family)